MNRSREYQSELRVDSENASTHHTTLKLDNYNKYNCKELMSCILTVVISCYHPGFSNTDLRSKRGPSPGCTVQRQSKPASFALGTVRVGIQQQLEHPSRGLVVCRPVDREVTVVVLDRSRVLVGLQQGSDHLRRGLVACGPEQRQPAVGIGLSGGAPVHPQEGLDDVLVGAPPRCQVQSQAAVRPRDGRPLPEGYQESDHHLNGRAVDDGQVEWDAPALPGLLGPLWVLAKQSFNGLQAGAPRGGQVDG
eukprot:scaffold213622_cov43-Prasinocladus_malaysianus.AAC.2